MEAANLRKSCPRSKNMWIYSNYEKCISFGGGNQQRTMQYINHKRKEEGVSKSGLDSKQNMDKKFANGRLSYDPAASYSR